VSTEHVMLAQEFRAADRTASTYEAVVDLARKAVQNGVLKGPVPAREAAFRKLNKLINDGMSPVRSRQDHTVSRSGRTSTHEALHVVIMPEPSLQETRRLRLVSIRLLIAHDEIAVEKLPLQSVFRIHAAQRLFYRGNIEHGCFKVLGEELLSWYYASAIASRLLEETGASRLMVPGPAMDGLILGQLDETAAVPAGEMFRFGKTQEAKHEIPASPYAPSLYSGNTYIGENEVRPIQKELRECFLRWREHYSRDYERGLERTIWPYRTVVPADRSDRISSEAIEALKAFLLDHRAQVAMGNWFDDERLHGNVPGAAEEEVPLLRAG
jgi:hypothetical protein